MSPFPFTLIRIFYNKINEIHFNWDITPIITDNKNNQPSVALLLWPKFVFINSNKFFGNENSFKNKLGWEIRKLVSIFNHNKEHLFVTLYKKDKDNILVVFNHIKLLKHLHNKCFDKDINSNVWSRICYLYFSVVWHGYRTTWWETICHSQCQCWAESPMIKQQ